MFRLSLRELFVLVAAIALVLVSMRSASLLWQSLVGIVAILVTIGLLMATIFDRGSRQAFAIGFCIVTLGYGLLVIWFGGYSREQTIGISQMPTTLILVQSRHMFDHIGYINAETGETVPDDGRLEMTSNGGYTVKGQAVHFAELPLLGSFVAIGHFWLALLFGYIGGRFARFFYERRCRDASSAT